MERMASAAEADRGLRQFLKAVSPRRLFFTSPAYRVQDQARAFRGSATLPRSVRLVQAQGPSTHLASSGLL